MHAAWAGGGGSAVPWAAARGQQRLAAAFREGRARHRPERSYPAQIKLPRKNEVTPQNGRNDFPTRGPQTPGRAVECHLSGVGPPLRGSARPAACGLNRFPEVNGALAGHL